MFKFLNISDKFFYYLAYFILIAVLLCVLNKLFILRKQTLEGLSNMDQGISTDGDSKRTSANKLIQKSKDFNASLQINKWGPKGVTGSDTSSVYEDILEELNDLLHLGQLASLLKYVDTSMNDEETLKLGERVEKYKLIREACHDSLKFLRAGEY